MAALSAVKNAKAQKARQGLEDLALRCSAGEGGVGVRPHLELHFLTLQVDLLVAVMGEAGVQVGRVMLLVNELVKRMVKRMMEEMVKVVVKVLQVEEKELEKLVRVRESKGSIQR